MSSIPPLSVTVNAKKWSCVLDTDLALSRFGLLLAQRLGEEFNLWLVRELWQILDNTQYYQSNPELLIPARMGEQRLKHGPDKDCALLGETLNQWELARIETDIAGLNVFWLGDAIRESFFPQGIDQHLIYRFETLAGSLDERINSTGRGGDDNIFTDCYRDAAALTVALMPYKGFILTRQGYKTDEFPENDPIICSYLREWGIRCYRVGIENKTRIEREYIDPILARTGISELIWAGLKLAAVHIIVPQAVIMPRVRREETDFPEDLQEMPEDKEVAKKDWWEGAVCFWYPL